MRPEKLIISAFGPFAGRVVIDFALLGTDGLYLVSGDTGSGKTTIFDALSYALYGVTTSQNERNAESMRSHYASPEVRTFVELEFTEKGERYHIERVPSQTRPKKRGDGEIEEGASVKLTLPSGAVLSRKKEADEKIVSLIGMSGDQFSQIVMLAQGKFSRFLNSKTEEKRELFKSLFNTDNYAKLQENLSAKAKEAKEKVRQLEDGQRAIVSSLSLGEESAWREKLEEAKASEHLPPDTFKLIEDSQSELSASFKRAEENASNLADEIKSLELKIGQMAERKAKCASLEAKKAELEVSSKKVEEAKEEERLNKGREEEKNKNIASLVRLEHLLPQYEECDGQKAELLKKTEEMRREKQKLSSLTETIEQKEKTLRETKASLDRLKDIQSVLDEQRCKESALSSKLNLLSEAIETARERDKALLDAKSAERRLKEREKEIEEKQKAGCELKAKEAELESELETLKDLSLMAVQAKEREETFSKLKAIDKEIFDKEKELKEIETKLVVLVEEHRQKAQKRALMHSAFYAALAASFAKDLAEGEPCPVCGSANHPSPAKAKGESYSQEQLAEADDGEKHALSLVTNAESEKKVKLAELTALRTKFNEWKKSLPEKIQCDGLEALEAQLQMERKKLNDELARRLKLNDSLLQTQNDIEQNGRELNLAERERDKAETEQEHFEKDYKKLAKEAEEKARGAESEVDQLDESYQRLKKEVEEAKTLLEKLGQEREKANELNEAYNGLNAEINELINTKIALEGNLKTAAALVETMDKNLSKLNKTLGYESAEEVRGLIEELDGKNAALALKIEEVSRRLSEAKEASSALKGSIAELEGQIALLPEFDEEALNAQLACLKEEQEKAEKKKAELQASFCLFASALEKYGKNERKSAELMERRKMLQELSDVANGALSGENKLSLETYIQTRYLDRILLRANRKLLSMSDGQYELERSAEARSKGRKMGLDIDVMDHFTGKSRPASTLSGGETFKASLALALGLSEEIQASAGAVKIETMFVDEGFGSLDEESLHAAVKTLSSLASGGRLVGVISHVEELKNSIDRQIIVTKNPNSGSCVELKV